MSDKKLELLKELYRFTFLLLKDKTDQRKKYLISIISEQTFSIKDLLTLI